MLASILADEGDLRVPLSSESTLKLIFPLRCLRLLEAVGAGDEPSTTISCSCCCACCCCCCCCWLLLLPASCCCMTTMAGSLLPLISYDRTTSSLCGTRSCCAGGPSAAGWPSCQSALCPSLILRLVSTSARCSYRFACATLTHGTRQSFCLLLFWAPLANDTRGRHCQD